MRNRGRGRNAGRRLVAVGAGGLVVPTDPAHTILTITGPDGNGNAVVTTEGAHELLEATFIIISGTSNGAYNGAAEVAADPAPGVTEFSIAVAYDGDSTGGSWVLQ